MISPDIKRFIKEEIRNSLSVILTAKAGESTNISETVDALYVGSPSIPSRPIMHPYGFTSRAPKGTTSVVARLGDHIGNRMVLGHRASDRPDWLDEGESVLYSVGKFYVIARNNGLKIRKDDDEKTIVLGEPLSELLLELIETIMDLNDQIVQHTHAAPGAPPSNAAQFQLINLTFDGIISDKLDPINKLLADDEGF